MRLIDVDLKIRGNPAKSEKVTKYFSHPFHPRGSLFLNFRGNTLFLYYQSLFSFYLLYSIRDDLNLAGGSSCSHRTGPRSKKLFSITIMSGAQEKHKGGKTKEVDRKAN